MKQPMGLTTKLLLGCAAFAALAFFYPQGIFWVSIAGSVMFVALWFSRTKGQRSGRLVPALLLVGVPWGVVNSFYDGVAQGKHLQDGFLTSALVSGAVMPVGIYVSLLTLLWVFDLMIEFAKMIGSDLGPQNSYGSAKEEPGIFSKYWWF